MSNKVGEGSLFYNALVSLDVEYPRSREILTNRVKRLKQDERSELIDNLNKFIKAINTPSGQPTEPLTERGVGILLLTDNGTYERSDGLIERFVRGCRNLFGDRISSESVIEKIIEIKRLLPTPKGPPAQLDHESIKAGLVKEIKDLKAEYTRKVGEGTQTEKMEKLDASKKLCETCHENLSEKIELIRGLTVEVTPIQLIGVLKQVEVVCKAINKNGFINDYTVLYRALEKTKEYVREINQAHPLIVLQMLREDRRYLTKEQQDLLKNIESHAANGGEVIMQELIRLVYASTLNKVEKFYHVLNSDYNTEQSELNKLTDDINLLQARHDLLTADESTKALNAFLHSSNNNCNKLDDKIKLFSDLIELTEGLIRETGSDHESNLMMLSSCISAFDFGTDRIGNKFISHIDFLYSVLSEEESSSSVNSEDESSSSVNSEDESSSSVNSEDESSSSEEIILEPAHLKPAYFNPIKMGYLLPAHSDTSTKIALKEKLHKELNVSLASLDVNGKKAYFNNYLQYLKIVLEADQQLHVKELRAITEEMRQPERGFSARQTSSLSAPARDLDFNEESIVFSDGRNRGFSVKVGDETRSTDELYMLPDHEVFVERQDPQPSPQERLHAYVYILFSAPGDTTTFDKACALVASNEALKKDVHQNFYYIMLNHDKVRNDNKYWSSQAFQGTNSASYIKGSDNGIINQYRFEAMFWASEGVTFKSVDDFKIVDVIVSDT